MVDVANCAETQVGGEGMTDARWMRGDAPETIVDRLAAHAKYQPQKIACKFYESHGASERSLTYGELHSLATNISRQIARLAAPQERVALVYQTGWEFVSAFLGCLYAGVVAVPADAPRRGAASERLRRIVADADARLLLTSPNTATEEFCGAIQASGTKVLTDLAYWASSDLGDQLPRLRAARPDDMALLQYTSGSTREPKGVIISHANLMANQRAICEAFGHDSDSIVVGWLPMHHDMGLIGNLLQPLYLGATAVFMTPTLFMQRPLRWLEMVHKHRATTSGAPTFAYEMCARLAASAPQDLDLSCWSVAFVGAEPIRAETLDRFCRAFAGFGFDRGSISPCYGLAESTLMVTGGRPGAGAATLNVDSTQLQQGRACPVGSVVGSNRLVSCGRPVRGLTVAVVDPQDGRLLGDGLVGEIWARGDSVARGYWRGSEPFAAVMRDVEGGCGVAGHLRTGDLGFLMDGDLYVTGRLKDLIIISGRNIFPADAEAAALEADDRTVPGGCAAFGLPSPERGDRLVIVAEAARGCGSAEAAVMADRIRARVVETLGVAVEVVQVIRRGGAPRTTSGKIRRGACREAHMLGSLPVLAEWRSDGPPPHRGELDPHVDSDIAEAEDWAERWITDKLASKGPALTRGVPLVEVGLDSIMAIELIHEVERRTGVLLDVEWLLTAASLEDILGRIRERAAEPDPHAAIAVREARQPPVRQRSSSALSAPLASSHAAMWFAHHADPQQSYQHHIAIALRLQAELDAGRLARAWDQLIARHPAFRTGVQLAGRDLLATIVPGMETKLQVTDAAEWTGDRLQRELVAVARLPFDLARPPLIRGRLLQRGGEAPILLVVVHHLVADFWSLANVAAELGQLYSGEESLSEAWTDAAYAETLRLQVEQEAEAATSAELDRWLEDLSPPPPALLWAPDPGARAGQANDKSGEQLWFEIDPRMAEKLRQLARRHSATLCSILLAAYQRLIANETGRGDFCVGVPVASRLTARTSAMVGNLVNVLPLRVRIPPSASSSDLISQAKQGLLNAIARSAVSFPQIVRGLRPPRDGDRHPLYQAVFVMHDAPHAAGGDLRTLAVPGARSQSVTVGGLTMSPMPLDLGVAQFELTLALAEVDDGVQGVLQYRSALFSRRCAERLVANYRGILHDL